MSDLQVRRDLEFLVDALPHRGACTDAERRAAEYLLERFQEHAPDAELDDFETVESELPLRAAYFAEFAIVALAATWWPRLALIYGSLVFVAYLAEALGYRIFSRLLPRYESQNVCARMMAPDPRRLVVVTAQYDSPADALFYNPPFLPWLRPAHSLAVASMLAVVLTAAVQAVGQEWPAVDAALFVVRWSAAGGLLAGAGLLLHSAAHGDFVRGANFNASGAAALLALSRMLAETPLEHTDVWLVATGSGSAGRGGIRHLLARHRPPVDNTAMVSLAHVGAGALHYTTHEGFLTARPTGSELAAHAQAVAGAYGATPARLHAVPSECEAMLARGYQAISVAALDEAGLPKHWSWHTDILPVVDLEQVECAAAFAETLLRRLDAAAA